MNITSEIKNEWVVDKYKIIIDNNPEIQFYYNPTIEHYQFKDSRFSNTASVWDNGNFATISRLINGFVKHIDNIK